MKFNVQIWSTLRNYNEVLQEVGRKMKKMFSQDSWF